MPSRQEPWGLVVSGRPTLQPSALASPSVFPWSPEFKPHGQDHLLPKDARVTDQEPDCPQLPWGPSPSPLAPGALPPEAASPPRLAVWPQESTCSPRALVLLCVSRREQQPPRREQPPRLCPVSLRRPSSPLTSASESSTRLSTDLSPYPSTPNSREHGNTPLGWLPARYQDLQIPHCTTTPLSATPPPSLLPS